jgi:hypothetical protein
MIQIYVTIIKFYLFSLGGGDLKILTEARSKIIKGLFEDKKLSIHKNYIKKAMKTKITHPVVKGSSFISVNS